jgi:hypothetical protein
LREVGQDDIPEISLDISDETLFSLLVEGRLVLHVHPEIDEEVEFEQAASHCRECEKLFHTDEFGEEVRIHLEKGDRDHEQDEHYNPGYSEELPFDLGHLDRFDIIEQLPRMQLERLPVASLRTGGENMSVMVDLLVEGPVQFFVHLRLSDKVFLFSFYNHKKSYQPIRKKKEIERLMPALR